MGLPLRRDEFADRLPTADETDSARELGALLKPFGEKSSPARIEVSHGEDRESFDLAPGVARMLVEVLRHFAAGRTVTLVPVGGMLTTQQAADLLNISRPHLIKLIDQEELAAQRVGRHRRLEAAAVLAYKRKRDAQRSKALDELMASDAEHF